MSDKTQTELTRDLIGKTVEIQYVTTSNTDSMVVGVLEHYKMAGFVTTFQIVGQSPVGLDQARGAKIVRILSYLPPAIDV